MCMRSSGCLMQESLKVEMALTEAKFESAQRSLEADLQAQMEKKVRALWLCFFSICIQISLIMPSESEAWIEVLCLLQDWAVAPQLLQQLCPLWPCLAAERTVNWTVLKNVFVGLGFHPTGTFIHMGSIEVAVFDIDWSTSALDDDDDDDEDL